MRGFSRPDSCTRIEELHTCADVRAFADWGVGEGLRMDYKEEIRLTRGGLKELAEDVSALPNAEAAS